MRWIITLLFAATIVMLPFALEICWDGYCVRIP